MSFVVGMVMLVAGGLLISYVFMGFTQKSMGEAVRAELKASGQAHEFADLPGGWVHYRLEEARSGDAAAPIIVLVHGFSTPSFVYDDYFVPLTEAGFRVLTFDLFGRGFSDRPSASYGVDFYVSQLAQLLGKLGIDGKVHLVGYSLGGPIVTRFANLCGDQVESLSLIAPAGLVTPQGQGPKILFAPMVGEWAFRVLLPTLMRSRFTDGFEYAPDPVAFEANFDRQFSYRGLDRALLRTIRAIGGGDFSVDFASPSADGIPMQALFSENDSVIPIASADRLAKINPQANIHRFEDGDHAIGYGKASEIATRIASFAAR